MRLSKSKIMSFDQCPFRFKVENIELWKAAITPIQLKNGINIHQILEDATKGSATFKQVEDLAINHKMYIDYKADVENFLSWQKKRKTPLFVEGKIFNDELNLSGVIDRIDEDKDGKLVLIDYKSGKSKNGMPHYRFELALYVHLFEKAYAKKIDRYGIYFTSQDRFISEDVDREEITKAIQKVKDTRIKIIQALKNDDFPKKPCFLCRYCSLSQNDKCHGQDEGFLTD